MYVRGQYLVAGIVLLMMGMVGCAEKPTETPLPASKPESSITGVAITGGLTRIYANGVDTDGLIEGYKFRIDGGAWTDWQAGSVLDTAIVYANLDDEHIVEAVVKDNEGMEDPTPATLAYTPRSIGTLNKTPDTAVKSPPSGASVSGAVIISWEGNDPDGTVAGYLWKMDWGAWTGVPSDVTSRTFTDLAVGAHTFSVKAKDNLGVIDPTPASLSFFVQEGFAPELEVTEGPSDGATFFVSEGATSDFTVGWEASVDYYYGAIEGYSYSFPAGGVDWQPVSEDLTQTTLKGLGASDQPYEISIRAVDAAGNTTEKKIAFSIVTPTMDKGILLVNGVHWGTYSDGSGTEATGDPWEMYEGRALFGNHRVTFWDAFSTGPDGGYPSTLGEPIGSGPLDGVTLGQYSTLIWVANGYQGDDDVWKKSKALIKSYLDAGGNVVLATRYGFAIGFVDADLMAYAHISEAVAIQTVTDENKLVAKVSGLVDVGPGNGESAVSATETCAVEDDPSVTVLFEYGATGEVAGLIAEPEGKGKFVYIAGRPYRFDIAASAANYDYILTHYLGEE